MTTVCCLYVRGHVPFTLEYVTRLSAMVRRWMDRSYRFVVFTDRPQEMPRGIEPIPITPLPDCKAWWNKLSIFDRKHNLRGRVLYLDLDTLIVSSLAPILDFPSSFALIPHAGTFEGKGKLKVVKRFNSSVMVWDADAFAPASIWWTFDISMTKRLWGDQDAIGEQVPWAATMPLSWFPRISELGDGPTPHAKVILMKRPKNAEAAKRYPWVAECWA